MEESQNGYLLIADITGYTAFLRESELEHAKDSLRSFLALLIEHTIPPLVISRLEGDAVISYAPEGSFLQGQTLVELIEGTYVEFRRALDLMVINTTCSCLACRNISNLDLKFFVHYGTFALERLHTYTELVSTDVNLIHRLTKNQVTQKTGYRAYVLYTQAALDQLDIPQFGEQMTSHVESYEHIGEVTVYLQDMHAVWEHRRHRLHTVVKPEEAVYSVEQDYPLPPAVLWDYLTKPQYRSIIFGADSQRIEDLKGGRIADGSVYICAHGENITQQSIIDWHPFEQYTFKSDTPGGGYSLATIRLNPQGDGTKVTAYAGKTQGGASILRSMLNLVQRRVIAPNILNGLQDLAAYIDEEISQGRLAQPPASQLPDEQIEDALVESLTGT